MRMFKYTFHKFFDYACLGFSEIMKINTTFFFNIEMFSDNSQSPFLLLPHLLLCVSFKFSWPLPIVFLHPLLLLLFLVIIQVLHPAGRQHLEEEDGAEGAREEGSGE